MNFAFKKLCDNNSFVNFIREYRYILLLHKKIIVLTLCYLSMVIVCFLTQIISLFLKYIKYNDYEFQFLCIKSISFIYYLFRNLKIILLYFLFDNCKFRF